MPSLIILFFIYSSLCFAKVNSCYQEVTQAEKNECMLFERDQAVGRLMTRVSEYCAKKDELREAKGGSIYPMLVDECLAKTLDKLTKRVDEID